MRGLARVIGGALGGAAIGGAISFFCFRLFLRLPAPFSEAYFGATIGSIFGAVLQFIRWRWSARRASEIAHFARSSGFKYSDAINRSDLGPTFDSVRIFSNWYQANHLVCGKHQGRPFRIFDLTRCIDTTSYDPDRGHQRSTSYPRHTVVLVSGLKDAPKCEIHRKSLVRNLFEIAVPILQGGKLKPLNEKLVNASLLSSFRRKYAAIPKEPVVQFDGRLLQDLLKGRGWSVDCDNQHAVFYTRRGFLPTRDFVSGLNEVTKLVKWLESDESHVAVESINKTIVVSKRGLLQLFVGAAAGLFLSMLIFFPLFVLWAKHFPMMVFLWPVLGMACMAGGIYIAKSVFRSSD